MDHPPRSIVSSFGLFAVRAATLLAPLAIFLALPPFYTGIWVQVEGAMPWLHGISALAALGCALLAWTADEDAHRALTHPLVLIPAAMFALAVLLLPVATLPALSLFGAPEHGFGAAAFLDLAALTAAAFVTLRDVAWRRLVLGVTFVTVAVAFVLDALFRVKATWAPFFFGDYLAFYAVFVFAILGTLARGRPILVALAGGLCLVLGILSSNKALFLAFGGAIAVLALSWRDRSTRTAVWLSVIMPPAVGAAIVLVGSTWTEAIRASLLATSGLGPLPALLADSWASIWSRAMLVVVGAQNLIDAPWRLLVGEGWGHYNEALLANLSIVQGRLHEFIGPSQVYWDALRRADFHSHNQYFEALLSSGIAAAGLMIAHGAATVFTAPVERRRLALFVILLLVTLQSFWFQMPHTLPVMAIAMVILVGSDADTGRVVRRHWAVPAGSLVAFGILAASGTLVGIGSNNIARERAAIDRIVRAGSDEPFERLFAAGLREVYDTTLIQHVYASTPDEKSPRGMDILNIYVAAAMEGGGPKSLKLAVSTTNILSGIAFTRPLYRERFGLPDVEFRAAVEGLVRRAPRRSDLAIPYFNHLMAAGREAEALDLANLILARRVDDPVGLWFSGIVLLGKEATSAAGMKNLRRSLLFGIRNLMPVDADIVRAIEY